MESYKPELYINLACKEFTLNYHFLNYCILCVLASVVFNQLLWGDSARVTR